MIEEVVFICFQFRDDFSAHTIFSRTASQRAMRRSCCDTSDMRKVAVSMKALSVEHSACCARVLAADSAGQRRCLSSSILSLSNCAGKRLVIARTAVSSLLRLARPSSRRRYQQLQSDVWIAAVQRQRRPALQVLNENGGTSLPANESGDNWVLEESLDVECAHAIAPKANIILLASGFLAFGGFGLVRRRRSTFYSESGLLTNGFAGR
jgi:hypothetical protein